MATTTPASSATAPPLIRELGLLDATMIVMGSMIGSGIFITSAESARQVGAPGWLLVAWVLAGLLTLTGALCCAELAAMLPRAGGQYVFLREAYGRPTGFLFGWAMFLVVQTGTIAAVAVAFAKFLGVLLPRVAHDNYLIRPVHIAFGRYAVSLSTEQLVALALIVVLTVTNTRGLKIGKQIQNSFTIAKTAALFGLIVAGLAFGINHGSAAWTASWWDPAANGWDPVKAGLKVPAVGGTALALLLGQALIGPLFSQSAWNNVTFTGGETRNPGWTLPRALLLGCGCVVGLYLLANVAYIVTLTLPEIQDKHDRVGTRLMEAVLGRPGTVVMALAILVSTFGCVNGLILAGARVYYAMARDGLFFKAIGTTNRQHVPAVALLAQGLWAALLVLPVTVTTNSETLKPAYKNLYSQLLQYIIPVDVTFYMLMVGAVIVLRRRRPDLERPYRTWGHPLPALIYIGLAVFLIVDFVALAPETSGIGFLILLAGLPVYFIWSRTSEAPSS